MAASYRDISGWFDEAARRGATHLIVACDTFDWSDYPVYVMPGTDPKGEVDRVDGQGMQQVMEVYAIHLDRRSQMAEHRSFHLERPVPS